MTCHCGWDGTGDHLCHRCGKRPGSRRFYVPIDRYSLAGTQGKVSARPTWGCDECWKDFKAVGQQSKGET